MFVRAHYLVGITLAIVPSHIESLFQDHMARYNLQYGTPEEYAFRLNIFADKHGKLAQINAENANFEVGHNKFSDWTDQEYQRLLGFKRTQRHHLRLYGVTPSKAPTFLEEEKVPQSIDWRKLGAVNPVKNQGHCGSCWAFSATCAIEGAHFIKTGKLLNLSEQQLVDCDRQSNGCNGGLQEYAMKYLEGSKQEQEKDYPYQGTDNPCRFKPEEGMVIVEKIHDVPEGSVKQLQAAIARGPTSVTIEADTLVFQHYTGGILDSEDCGTNLDHAVTAVGYGTENG